MMVLNGTMGAAYLCLHTVYGLSTVFLTRSSFKSLEEKVAQVLEVNDTSKEESTADAPWAVSPSRIKN